MTTATTIPSLQDLVRFLIARVDDDEDELKRVRRDESRGTARQTPLDGMRSVERLLDECSARRSVLAGAQQLLVLRDQPAEKAVRDVAAQLLYALAAPYRGHVSFRDEWRGSARH